MNSIWCAVILGITAFIYLSILIGIVIIYRAKKIGVRQFGRLPDDIKDKVSPRIAPSPFYEKQRTYRLCYGFTHTMDKLLLVTSVLYSALTAYMVIDDNASQAFTVIFLVISTSTSILKSSLGLERIARPYIEAVRIMENAILRYEYCTVPSAGNEHADHNSLSLYDPDYKMLLDANEKAEQLIQQKNE